jgi:hypothetical protein
MIISDAPNCDITFAIGKTSQGNKGKALAIVISYHHHNFIVQGSLMVIKIFLECRILVHSSK